MMDFLNALVTIGSVLLFLICVWLLVQYSDPEVDFKTKLIVLTSWYTNYLCIIFFAVDIYNTITYKFKKTGPEKSEISLYWAWRLIYWINFILNIFVIPIMSDFLTNGHFSYRDRLRTAVKTVAIYNTIWTFLGLIFLGYLIFSDKLHIKNTYLFVISLTNSV